MNAQFHTPSFGDEVVFDLADDSNAANQQQPPQQQQQNMHSKRMRSLDQSLDEYHTANDESFETVAQINNTSPNTSTYICTTPTTGTTTTTTLAARKQLGTPATDPNEPAKPLSAYALFFRDTVSAIKQQNPKCSFQDLSRIVASMWEALDATHKNVYYKKNEVARSEYIKQMHLYRQQQQQQQQKQQQQQEHDEMLGSSETNDLNGATLQTKPAVFTITRCSSNSNETILNTSANNFTNQMITPPAAPHQQQVAAFASPSPQQQQQQFNTTPQQLQEPQQQLNNNSSFNSAPLSSPQAQIAKTVTNNLNASPSVDTTMSTDPAQHQIQMLTEAGSVQKCTRDNCNKRAIINPDWEDEYCSNECVVIHCRNVFNTWVQSNLESRKQ